ncbi:MAG: hypothetical protein DMG75_00225 [Acidobacteria bacterium]|nr:MAG: hypothetical protein DMG75_00225 [Acidobacteriota bacterium]
MSPRAKEQQDKNLLGIYPRYLELSAELAKAVRILGGRIRGVEPRSRKAAGANGRFPEREKTLSMLARNFWFLACHWIHYSNVQSLENILSIAIRTIYAGHRTGTGLVFRIPTFKQGI